MRGSTEALPPALTVLCEVAASELAEKWMQQPRHSLADLDGCERFKLHPVPLQAETHITLQCIGAQLELRCPIPVHLNAAAIPHRTSATAER